MSDNANPSWSIGTKILAACLAGAGTLWGTYLYLRSRRKLCLCDRTVVIFGGSRGLGLALAREFTRHQARVVLCARNEQELEWAQLDLSRAGIAASAFACDATKPEQVAQTIDQIERDHGRIDVLVNCAGTIMVGPFETMTLQDFRAVMDINFWGALNTMLAVVPLMKARHKGRIINVGSIGGKIPTPHLAAYCASKFALVGLSGALGAELKKDGIYVTTVNPGLMRTGSPRNAQFAGNAEAEYAWFSISDSLPGVSMSAATAARRIVQAGIYGDPEVTIGAPAWLGAKFHGLMPSISLELAALANRLFPQANAAAQGPRPGYASESAITQSFLRSLGRKAEGEYNQYPAGQTVPSAIS